MKHSVLTLTLNPNHNIDEAFRTKLFSVFNCFVLIFVSKFFDRLVEDRQYVVYQHESINITLYNYLRSARI